VIELEAVTPENYAETLTLAVTPDQERLISPVVKSLSDAFVWSSQVRVAREEDRLVGFVMAYAFEWEGEQVVNIVRFLIDQRHQGRGLGRELLTSTLDWIASFEPTPVRARISTYPDNERALALYRSAGFDGSDMVDGEIVLWKELPTGL
jgi:diamine N-acetyltransferase